MGAVVMEVVVTVVALVEAVVVAAMVEAEGAEGERAEVGKEGVGTVAVVLAEVGWVEAEMAAAGGACVEYADGEGDVDDGRDTNDASHALVRLLRPAEIDVVDQLLFGSLA